MNYEIFRCDDFELDGRLTDPQWKKASVWELARPGDAFPQLGPELNEKGWVRALCSDNYLYIGVEMEDSDVVNQGRFHQSHLYKTGDTIELFFKPSTDTYYWEMYGSPQGLKTTFFYPSRSYVFLPESELPVPEFEVKTHIDGTFNNWQIEDNGWSIEFKLPLSTFEQYGAKFRSGEVWEFLIARQNYSRRLARKELSTVPPIAESDFHFIEQYGKVVIR